MPNAHQPTRRTLRGLALVVQPFPALISAAAGAAFYVVASHAANPPGAVMVLFSIFLTCASFNALNDYCDIDLDRQTKPGKPIPRGDIGPAAALATSIGTGALGLLLSLGMSTGAFAVAAIALAAGIVYDLWAKGTIWSWVPYGVFIPALPVWGFLAAGRFTPIVLLSFPLGALMSLALNLANTIPDLVGDTAFGLRGLTHRLGLRRSLAVTWTAFAATIALLALTPTLFGNDPSVLFPGIAVGVVLLAATIIDVTANRTHASLARGWYLSAVLAVVLGISWIASLPTAWWSEFDI